MWKRLLFVASVFATGSVGLLLTSLATGASQAESAFDAPARELPSVVLSEADRLALQNLVGRAFSDPTEALDDVRTLGSTSAGHVLVVPAGDTVCVAVLHGKTPVGACSHAQYEATEDPPLLVLTRLPNSPQLVGGGLVTGEDRHPSLTINGREIPTERVKSGFIVQSNVATTAQAADHVTIEAEYDQ
jgi:hypothetical protein